MTRERLDPEDRKSQILDVAMAMAKKDGYTRITRDAVASKAKVSTGLVTMYFSMDALRDAIIKLAVKRGIAEIVAQGLANRHPVALRAPQELKERAASLLTN
jgi:AcrR family transcriptional regulator